MTEPTVESIFGTKAGVIYQSLNQHGPSNIGDLAKTTSLIREEVYCALGWLGREDKIVLEQKGRTMVFSLKKYESQSEPVAGTTMEVTTPRKQPIRTKFKAPKKTKKVRKSKPPARFIESSAKQADRTEEFLLH